MATASAIEILCGGEFSTKVAIGGCCGCSMPTAVKAGQVESGSISDALIVRLAATTPKLGGVAWGKLT
jgi:hypothetical protein